MEMIAKNIYQVDIDEETVIYVFKSSSRDQYIINEEDCFGDIKTHIMTHDEVIDYFDSFINRHHLNKL